MGLESRVKRLEQQRGQGPCPICGPLWTRQIEIVTVTREEFDRQPCGAGSLICPRCGAQMPICFVQFPGVDLEDIDTVVEGSD